MTEMQPLFGGEPGISLQPLIRGESETRLQLLISGEPGIYICRTAATYWWKNGDRTAAAECREPGTGAAAADWGRARDRGCSC